MEVSYIQRGRGIRGRSGFAGRTHSSVLAGHISVPGISCRMNCQEAANWGPDLGTVPSVQGVEDECRI